MGRHHLIAASTLEVPRACPLKRSSDRVAFSERPVNRATTARRSPVILVIPACDEAASIRLVLSEVPPELVADVIVVVGSANDPTARVAAAQEARVLVQSRPGYGAACSEGARLATALGAEVVVFLDGDYSDPPLELASVLAPVLMGEADLVLGCRDLKAHPKALSHQYPPRKWPGACSAASTDWSVEGV